MSFELVEDFNVKRAENVELHGWLKTKWKNGKVEAIGISWWVKKNILVKKGNSEQLSEEYTITCTLYWGYQDKGQKVLSLH